VKLRHRTLELGSEDAGPTPAELAQLSYDRLVLRGYGPTQQMPDTVLLDGFSRRLREIKRAADRGIVRPYSPFRGLGDASETRVLSVFPAAPIPLDKGANRRVFQLNWYLNRCGIATDLLVTTSSRWKLRGLADLLGAIACEVHTYRNDKPPLGARARARREVERLHRLSRGVLRRPPELFSERLATRASRDGKRCLAELVASGRYRAVIINFAWMTGLLDAARDAAPSSTHWICDTHDVQFVRNSTQDRAEARVGVDAEHERRAELDALRRYDSVLAISQADLQQLRQVLPEQRLVWVPSGFDYAHQPLGTTPAQPPYVFGFIGRAMRANALALSLLIAHWWPAIARASPKSRLLIAGTICQDPEMRRIVKGLEGVRMLGFVPTLAQFYRQIDIALNPVVVQGGLNFKSLEALAAGRLLITNEMGQRCLGADAPVLTVQTPHQLQEAIAELSAAPDALHRRRRDGQNWYEQQFAEERAYAPLRELLG
jgi:hypothetical protein